MVGAGREGSTLGTLWAKAGSQVMFSSRHPEELKSLVDGIGPAAQADTVEQAVTFGDVVAIVVPYTAMRSRSATIMAQPSPAKWLVLDVRYPIAQRDGEETVKCIGADGDYEALVARVVGFVEAPSLGPDLPLDIRGTASSSGFGRRCRKSQSVRRSPTPTSRAGSARPRRRGPSPRLAPPITLQWASHAIGWCGTTAPSRGTLGASSASARCSIGREDGPDARAHGAGSESKAMHLQNRVTPFGDIVAILNGECSPENRGIIHDPRTKSLLSKRWTNKAWLICSCEYRGRRREIMGTQSWTELFFLDEAVALAAGHRPCFLCRRKAAEAFRAAWAKAKGGAEPTAGEMDAALHTERLISGRKRDTPSGPISSICRMGRWSASPMKPSP